MFNFFSRSTVSFILVQILLAFGLIFIPDIFREGCHVYHIETEGAPIVKVLSYVFQPAGFFLQNQIGASVVNFVWLLFVILLLYFLVPKNTAGVHDVKKIVEKKKSDFYKPTLRKVLWAIFLFIILSFWFVFMVIAAPRISMPWFLRILALLVAGPAMLSLMFPPFAVVLQVIWSYFLACGIAAICNAYHSKFHIKRD